MLHKIWRFILSLFGFLVKQEAVRFQVVLTKLSLSGEKGKVADMADYIVGSVLLAEITPVDKNGLTAKLDSVPAWSTTDPAVVTVEPSEDGLSATLTAVGLGAAFVEVSADADLDDDEVRVISATIPVVVKEPEAVSFEVTLTEQA